MTIFLEAQSRVGELSLYIMPRFIETLWNMMKKHGGFRTIKYADVVIMGVALAVLMGFLHTDGQYIKPTYRSTLGYLFGTN